VITAARVPDASGWRVTITFMTAAGLDPQALAALTRLRARGWTDEDLTAFTAAISADIADALESAIVRADNITRALPGVTPQQAAAWALHRRTMFRAGHGWPAWETMRTHLAAAGGDHSLARAAITAGVPADTLTDLIAAGDTNGILLLAALR